jgi:hypothetical protein
MGDYFIKAASRNWFIICRNGRARDETASKPTTGASGFPYFAGVRGSWFARKGR